MSNVMLLAILWLAVWVLLLLLLARRRKNRKAGNSGDLIEYTLLLAFVAMASAALFASAGTNIKSIWTKADEQLQAAPQPAPFGSLDRYQGDTYTISKRVEPIPNTSLGVVEIERSSDHSHYNALVILPYNLLVGIRVVPRQFSYRFSESAMGLGRAVYLDSPNSF